MMVIITQGPRLQMIPFRVFTFFSATLFFYLVIDVAKIILAKQLKHRLTPVNIYKIKISSGPEKSLLLFDRDLKNDKKFKLTASYKSEDLENKYFGFGLIEKDSLAEHSTFFDSLDNFSGLNFFTITVSAELAC